MIAWPDLFRESPATGGPVAPPLKQNAPGESHRVDTPRKDIGNDPAPAIPAPAGPAPSALDRRALTGGIFLAFFASILVHGAIVAFVADRLTVEGMEAASAAVSVELIFDTPAQKPAEPVAGPESEDREPEAENARSEEPDQPDDLQQPLDPAPPQASQPAANTAGPETPPATPSAPTEQAEQAANEDPVPDLPQDTVPLPTPRPEPPVAGATSKSAPARNSSDTTRPAKAPPQAAKSAQEVTQSGRKGGASRGEIASYQRRLYSHLLRHQSYPHEAARRKIAGTATVNIALDRRGRLVAATLRRGTGSAILDREALATARRAAPYPKPPEGFGGETISFAVPLDFRP